MTVIGKLEYISRSGLCAEVGHPLDDPYQGRPKSELGLSVMQDGPVGVVWTFDGKRIEKRFGWRIQVVLERSAGLVVVIGHWNSPLDGYPQPNNGVVFSSDGNVFRSVSAPPEILGARARNGQTLIPDGLSVVELIDGEIKIWLSYWQGDWHEQRIYDPVTGVWGKVTGQYRAV